MSGVFIDSSVFLKILEGDGKAKRYFIDLLRKNKIYRNPIVFSEVLYVWLRLTTGKKSFELKKSPEIIKSKLEEMEKIEKVLDLAEELIIDKEVEKIACEIIKTYALLPNDALIAATCKANGISKIATFDEDFKRVDFLEVVGT